MRVRKLMLAAVSLAAAATMAPAHAEDVNPDEVAGVNTGLAGFVTYDGQLSHNDNSYRVSTNCTFAGALTPNNTLVVEFGGAAVISTNDETKIPQLTRIRCVIRGKDSSGNAVEAESAIQLNGNASVVASSTALDESGPKEWGAAPITVCSEGVGVFGNINPVIVRIPLTCKTPTP